MDDNRIEIYADPEKQEIFLRLGDKDLILTSQQASEMAAHLSTAVAALKGDVN